VPVVNLGGKTAFIAGASSAVGRACAVALAGCGAQICLADDDERRVSDVAATLGMPKVLALPLDFRDEASWRKALEDCLTGLGSLDVLVLCPSGRSGNGAIVDTSLESFRDTLYETGFTAWLGQKQGVLAMRAVARGGAIIHVTSVLGVMAAPGVAACCAGAAGSVMSARAAALECAKAGDGIVVNTVLCGAVEGCEPGHLPDAPRVQPEDVAAAVVFYATDGARYMTGTELPVDGGLLCR